jgi:hypothetical protein
VVGRNRVLRLMHENQLLSPYRHPPRPANDHTGTILTTAPDRLWGTDASMVQTVQDGRVWVFAALDHFNSEVGGHHVSTDGSRFAALEPVSQAFIARFGGIEADAVSVTPAVCPNYWWQNSRWALGVTELHCPVSQSDGEAALIYCIGNEIHVEFRPLRRQRPENNEEAHTEALVRIKTCVGSGNPKLRHALAVSSLSGGAPPQKV